MELALILTTAVSVVLAISMGIVAWRLARAERLRSAARVAALAADLSALESREQVAVAAREPARIHPIARRSNDFDSIDLRPGRAAVASGEMFRAEASAGSRSRLAAVLAVGSFAVAASLALVIATSRGGSPIAEPLAPAQTLKPVTAADVFPLELVALGHNRSGDRITIRGVVRNPREGGSLEQLTAVAYLFDREGTLLGNGRAAVEMPALAPGAGSAFAVTVDHAANVGRYRVSFKTGDRIVPHVDRRNPRPVSGVDR